MKEYGPSASSCSPSTVIRPRCHLHGLSRPILSQNGLKARLISQLAACRLPASAARPSASLSGALAWSSIQQCRSHSCTHCAFNAAFEERKSSCSKSVRPEPRAPFQCSSLRLKCMPLDRRWHSQSACQCLSDAVGPLAGGAEAARSGRDADGHDAKHAKAHQPLLEVPWTAGKIVSVMFLWFLAFWMLGYCAVPNSLDLLGLDGADLSARGQALLHLLLECGELGATVGILWHSLRAYQPLGLGWFRARLRPLRAWLCPALLACAFFPLVDLAAARSQGWFPIDKDLWGPNMMEQNLAAGDVVSKAVYFVVVTVCAPVWEETIFRGFLLPSLTKYMPAMAAVAVSALGFAGAHFSMQRFLPIMLLGMILGTLYVRTRNLLPCVLLHSLWNAYIFWQLTCRGTVVM